MYRDCVHPVRLADEYRWRIHWQYLLDVFKEVVHLLGISCCIGLQGNFVTSEADAEQRVSLSRTPSKRLLAAVIRVKGCHAKNPLYSDACMALTRYNMSVAMEQDGIINDVLVRHE